MGGIGMSVCVDMDVDIRNTSVWVPSEVARILGAGSVCVVEVLVKEVGSCWVYASAYSRFSVKVNDWSLLALLKPRCRKVSNLEVRHYQVSNLFCSCDNRLHDIFILGVVTTALDTEYSQCFR